MSIQSPNTSQPREVPGVRGASWLAWSPDSKKLAFVGAEDAKSAPHLYSENADGSDLVQLTSGDAATGHFAWAPDSKHLAFVRLDPDRGYSTGPDGISLKVGFVPHDTIREVDADGKNDHPVIDTPGGNTSPSWSPDGQKILYTNEQSPGWNRDNQSLLMVANADGSSPSSVVGRQVWDAGWSPDGSVIAFSDPSGFLSPNVHTVHPDGTADHVVKHGARFAGWSPDGQSLAFSKNQGLYLADRNGNHAQHVAGSPSDGGASLGSWSADGQITYGVGGHTYLANSQDGSSGKPILPDGRQEAESVLSPDGKHIAVTELGQDKLHLLVLDVSPSGDTLRG